MRTSDIDLVGDANHLTFFEMLGNFSFDDYFKREAIEFAWDLVTKKFGLDGDRIWPTVFAGEGEVPRDDESAAIWEDIGVPRERIRFFGREDNFWGPTGDSGPCGPCSELHYQLRPPPMGEEEVGPNLGGERFLELWNLVFNQFHQAANGLLTPLPAVGVDTGAGLERWVVLLQDKDNVYATDLFADIFRRSMDALGVEPDGGPEIQQSLRIIAEHTRASVFLIGDGVMPGPEGRGYILRRLLRRVVGQALQLAQTGPFIADIADTTIDVMGRFYPEVERRRTHILDVMRDEEDRFGLTLSRGLRSLDRVLEDRKDSKLISGDVAFSFHDTYGVPFDLLNEIAGARGFKVDSDGFEREMEEQKERSRRGMEEQREMLPVGLGVTEFTGYDSLRVADARIVAIISAGETVSLLSAGEEASVVLDRTPFYAEAGGQVGDRGVIVSGATTFCVDDTRSVPELTRFHSGHLKAGRLEVGDIVEAVVDGDARMNVARNHTATHLLHQSLRVVLGEHVRQAGSLVAPDRLRFDITQNELISKEELHNVEFYVNQWVLNSHLVTTTETEVEVAIEAGAMALFGEKYGDVVRMVSIGDISKELCGGTHVSNTSEIGLVLILQEENIGSGIRRIEAVTGQTAAEYARHRLNTIHNLAATLEVDLDGVEDRVHQIMSLASSHRREIARLRHLVARDKARNLIENAEDLAGGQLIVSDVEVEDADSLRDISDIIQDHLDGRWAFLIGAIVRGKPIFFAAASESVVAQGLHCGDAVKVAAVTTGGGGGGRADQASGGGKDPERFADGLAEARKVFVDLLRRD
jgi:alanyl-tRNA synthetase